MREIGILVLAAVALHAAVCEPDGMVKTALEEQQAARRDLAGRAAAIERFNTLAGEHPGDPAYAYLQARALIDTNTPRAIEILKLIAPDFALARIALADIYVNGKFMDRGQARVELSAFADACPGSLEPQFLSLARRTASPELAAKITPPLRARLEQAPVAESLAGWAALWGLEFQARPVPEHDAERERLVEDVRKIEQRAGKVTPALLSTIAGGYKAAGDTALSKQYADRLEAEFPASSEAANVRRLATLAEESKWFKEHPYPASANEEARRKYQLEELAYWEQRISTRPDDVQLLSPWFRALCNREGTTNEQVLAAADRLLAAARQPGGQRFGAPVQLDVAQTLVSRGLRLDSVAALVDEAMKIYGERPTASSDRFDDAAGTSLGFMVRVQAARAMVDLATKQERPEVARNAVEALKDLKSERTFDMARVWQLRGKFAELDRRKLDALLFYREASGAHPQPFYQRDVDRLWKDLGGTAESKGLMGSAGAGTSPRQPGIVAISGGWQKATKDLPPFALRDIAGKTWKLASLEGKTVLINLWATWCGPCREEHPHLQKLYDQLKERTDLQVITLNVDDEVVKVEPYMKENHYTFPVLMAKSYVDELLPSLTIPQNWIVDAHGKWAWQQTGFGSRDKWQAEILKQLETK